MMISTQPYKGSRDFYPEDKRLQKYIFKKMRSVVEGFGYEEYDAPILEPVELYLSKTSEEIVNEQTYVFEDRGGRKVTIRPEMTPTVSRMVAARRQELAYPLRWYSIPNLWRYERPQRGRLREHWQLNVDLFGIAGIEAEHEIIEIADSIMQSFKADRDDYLIKVNSRQLINFIMQDYLQVSELQGSMLIKLIDRMNKMEPALFEAEIDAIFTPSQRDRELAEQLLELLKMTKFEELPLPLRAHRSVSELETLINRLIKSGVKNVEFDITLMRGFDYYTDIVFEIDDTHPDNNRSLFGGGRYDGLVAMFGVEPVPTIGFGVGDVSMKNFLESHDLIPKLKPETDAYVVLIGDVYDRAQKVIKEFREMGLNIAVDMTDRKPASKIKTAAKKGIRYVIFIGDQEIEDELYVVKDLEIGDEEKHSPSRIVSIIKDRRKNDSV